MKGGDQHTETNPADGDNPQAKRRKHFGVRYGPTAAASSPAPYVRARAPEPRQQQQQQPINHHHIQRAKAEAQLHGRKFHLDTSSCVAPEPDQLFLSQSWSVPEMMTEKKKLNDTKNLLDCKNIKPWGSHTSFTNRAGNVVRQIRQGQGEVELCTTAWAKMYESIVSFDLLPATGGATVGHLETGQPAVGSVHLCEAPGAFISATNHYIKTQRPDWHWEWIGNSLHPYYEGNDPAAMIDDDALIQGTLQHWHWGDDGSGDIRFPKNVAAICQSAGAMARDLHTGGALLVTADGSVDCQENPNEQETRTAPLHYCEMVTALGVLAPGGSFILKAFTLFEHPTICALYLLGALFHQVHVYKPATSKPGNSETYIIGKGFKGIELELHSFLVSHVGEEVYKDKALLPLESLPAAFLHSCTLCAAHFAGIQEQIISENLEMDQFMPPAQKSALNAAKHWMAQEWPRYFGLKPLARDGFLAPAVFLSGSNNNTSNPVHRREKHDGTLAERVVLGKRRREQLGIQSASDMQSFSRPSTSARQPDETLPFSHGAPDQAATGPLTGAPGGRGPSGGAAGPAEGMMAKWGYTPGMGLGKDLQGMANKVEASSNKGRAGLGLGTTHPLALTTTPDYTPKPDTAILTHDHAALSFEEMEWWRIMEQRKPAKLLRSKFLPQEDILLAMRTAREMSHAWLSHQADKSDDTVPNQAMPGNTVSSAEGSWAIPLLKTSPNNTSSGTDAMPSYAMDVPGSLEGVAHNPEAASNSPGDFCLHQAPCMAPQGQQHSRDFWNMASLDSAFNICSSLAAMQQSGGADANLSLLDLSLDDCGATEYLLTHGGVSVHSAQVLTGAAAEKLHSSGSHVAGVVQALLPSTTPDVDDTAMQVASVAPKGQSQDSTYAQTDVLAPQPVAGAAAAALGGAREQVTNLAAAEARNVALLPEDLAAEEQEVGTMPAAQSVDSTAEPMDVSDADVTDSTHTQAAAQRLLKAQRSRTAQQSAAVPAAYTLHSYEAMKASLKSVLLVIGSLGPHDGQGQAPIEREAPQAKGSSDGQHAVGNGQEVPTAQEGGIQHEGVMEAEYADSYRARLLWECAVALSCLQQGGTFIVQLPDCLTTFTVSMLYLLMRSFSGLSLVKPFTSCACDSSRFLVCFGRLEDDKVGALWLSEVLKRTEQLSSSGKIVGEFVPPSSYISSQLLEYVSRRNAALASLQTQALNHMKHLRDEGAQPDPTLQSQTALSARQQLALDPQIASPQLPTPSQKPAGLRAGPPTLGLGYTPAPHSGASPAPNTAPTATTTTTCTPSGTPALTPATPSALAPTSTSTAQHQGGDNELIQFQAMKPSLQPPPPHHQQQPQPQQQQQQQHGQQTAEGQTANSSSLGGDGSTKQWQGKLYVMNGKGEELVCELATDAWPAHLPRPSRLRVVEYMPAERALQSPKVKSIKELHLVHSKEGAALEGFKQYLKGFRGPGRDTSQPKLAVIKTQSYSILLGCPDSHEAASSTVSCWVI